MRKIIIYTSEDCCEGKNGFLWKSLNTVPVSLVFLICGLTKPLSNWPLILDLYNYPALWGVSLPSPLLEIKIRFWNLDSYTLSSFSSYPSPPSRPKLCAWILYLKVLLRATCQPEPQINYCCSSLIPGQVGVAISNLGLKETTKKTVRYTKRWWKEPWNIEQHLI